MIDITFLFESKQKGLICGVGCEGGEQDTPTQSITLSVARGCGAELRGKIREFHAFASFFLFWVLFH